MINLKKSLHAWGTDDFNHTLKAELQALGVDELPLQQGLKASSIALDDKLSAVILHTREHSNVIDVKAGLFYTGMVAGCACVDDPTPENELTEYCEVMLNIDRHNGDTKVTLLAD